MTDTHTEQAGTLEDGGSMELVRVPAWEVKYRMGEDPDELAHFVCCRDLDWRKAACGHEEPDMPIVKEAKVLCTMCIEVIRSLGGEPGVPICPYDQQACPDDEEVDRIIDERTSR
ncbi:hypothetical protein [Pseudarthrobacter sp. efr-133-R2A-89]|uniref:hypothetical protein n=1 Tax=Pseudarthrobacter sp. efr-133-R2A-89 TaxID=3040302 RepID=UPI002556A9F6|nr:hypothetical protein [Pseudarthrobacter sp. efr-133-R2A-89]